MNPADRVHPGIASLHPYIPGKPIEELARELGLDRIIKLASNENPLGPSPKALARLRETAAEVHRYPDGPGMVLKSALSERFGVAPDTLVLGNGSNELLELALRTFVQPGETVASAAVTFGVYGILAQAQGARYVTAPMRGMDYDLTALADVVRREAARLVFVANPNNPTGTAFGAEELRDFIAAVPAETIIVYDAAYAEYGAPAGIPDGLDLPAVHENVIVTRTFSKAHGLAGLRVGWGVAPAPLADFINRVRQPFNVSRPAQEAAVAALADEAFLAEVVELNRRGIDEIRSGLSDLGLVSWPSHANFVLFASPLAADELFQRLLHEGIIVRSMRSFGLPDHVRVNTGTAEENRLFLAALGRVLAAAGV